MSKHIYRGPADEQTCNRLRARRVFPVYTSRRRCSRESRNSCEGLRHSTSTCTGSDALDRPNLIPPSRPPTWSCQPPPEKEEQEVSANQREVAARFLPPVMYATGALNQTYRWWESAPGTARRGWASLWCKFDRCTCRWLLTAPPPGCCWYLKEKRQLTTSDVWSNPTRQVWMPNSNMLPRPDLFYFLTVSSHLLLEVTPIWYLRSHLLTFCWHLKQPACGEALWLPNWRRT